MTSEQNGLRFAAFATIAFGLLLALAAWPPLNLPIRLLSDLIIWPFDRTETLLASETRLALAIGGGVMAGWGAMIWQLAGAPMRAAPEATRRIILTSALTWFCVDSAASILAGAALNVLANTAFLALFLWPMRRSARAVLA